MIIDVQQIDDRNVMVVTHGAGDQIGTITIFRFYDNGDIVTKTATVSGHYSHDQIGFARILCMERDGWD